MSDLWQALPEDVRTTILIVAALGLFFLTLYWVGRLLTWRRKNSPLPWLMVLGGLLVLLGAGSLYLDAQPSIPGIVESKSEQIIVDEEGAVSHELIVRVRYTRPDTGQPRTGDLRADPAIYDRVSTGDTVDVRFLHIGGLISLVRLSERSTLSILFQAAANPTLFILALLVGLVALLWLLAKQPALKAISLLVFALLFALILIVEFLPQWRAAQPLRGPQETATATVQQVQTFTEIGGGGEDDDGPEPLIQPFDLVQVSFTPTGRREPVLAADMVDAGTLTLESGGSVPITYLLDNPRQIRLQGGARTYAWKNVTFSVASVIAVLLFFGALIVAWRALKRTLRRRPTG